MILFSRKKKKKIDFRHNYDNLLPENFRFKSTNNVTFLILNNNYPKNSLSAIMIPLYLKFIVLIYSTLPFFFLSNRIIIFCELIDFFCLLMILCHGIYNIKTFKTYSETFRLKTDYDFIWNFSIKVLLWCTFIWKHCILDIQILFLHRMRDWFVWLT